MGPRGGPRNGDAPKRSSTAGGKTRGGGGISKRRAGSATRADRDGDLDMDAPINGAAHKNGTAPTGPRRSTRSTTTTSRPPRPTANAKQIVQRVISGSSGSLASRISSGIDPASRPSRTRPINSANTIILRVEGLKSSRAVTNNDGGLKSLLSFIERKAQTVGKVGRVIRIRKSHLKGDFVYITTSKEDGEEILKVNGFDFAGAKLEISDTLEGVPTMSSDAQSVKEQLTAILNQRYDATTKLLNLGNLGKDPVLSEMESFREATPEKLFRAFMAICDGLFKTAEAKREAIISISLAGNNIDDVAQIMALTETFPDLINLDLSQNQFKDLKALRKWSHRLRNMQCLLLGNNPIEQADPNYGEELKRWFPKLQMLNGVQIRTPEEVAAIERANKPTVIPNNGPDFRDINGVGEGFITEFIRMYDTDRPSLAATYYDEQSNFSFAVSNRANNRAPQPSWHSYIKLSRNHTKITTAHARQTRLFTGTAHIQNVWRNLPPTRHPDLPTQLDKYIVDCHPVEGLADPSGQNPLGVPGMIMTVHGEFEDEDPETKARTLRSFSRTFLLGPGAPGRNPIRVISDMLALKAYNPLSPPQVSPEDAQKEQMVLELCKQTGLTLQYSKMCLEVASWNFDQALITFNSKRAELGPEAFVSTTV